MTTENLAGNLTDNLAGNFAGHFAGNFGSPVQLLILLAIVLLLFGGKRLRNLGGDLGGALKGFKSAMSNDQAKAPDTLQHTNQSIAVPSSELEKDRRIIGG